MVSFMGPMHTISPHADLHGILLFSTHSHGFPCNPMQKPICEFAIVHRARSLTLSQSEAYQGTLLSRARSIAPTYRVILGFDFRFWWVLSESRASLSYPIGYLQIIGTYSAHINSCVARTFSNSLFLVICLLFHPYLRWMNFLKNKSVNLATFKEPMKILGYLARPTSRAE